MNIGSREDQNIAAFCKVYPKPHFYADIFTDKDISDPTHRNMHLYLYAFCICAVL